MIIVDLEAHFLTLEFADYIRITSETRGLPRGSGQEIFDLGKGRLKAMDEAGIDVQVLSLATGHIQMLEPSEGIAWSRKINNELSIAINKYKSRFIGLATVAPQSPGEAADELERAVTELDLKGVCIQSHARNEYLDDRKYWVIFERAEKLDVPIYMHPSFPSTAILKPFADYGFPFTGPALGFAADLSLHVMRLIHSGLFDRYPKLKIILGHLGEGLPFSLCRLDFAWLKSWVPRKPAIEKKPSEYLKTNFTITTSGMFFQPAFLCAYLALGADRMGFAVDYPMENNEEAVKFLKEAPICDGDKEKIYHLNAEKLFKL